MAKKVIRQNQQAVRVQVDGPGTVWSVFRLGESSVTGKTDPGPGRTATFISDRFGNPVVGFSTTDPPAGLPSFTLTFFEETEVSYIEKERDRGCDLYMQISTSKCGALDNPNMWDVIDHYGQGRVGDLTPGDGPTAPFTGAQADMAGTLNFNYRFRVVRTTLSALTTTETEDLLDIAFLGDAICNDCGNGYPGADEIGYIVCAAGSGVTPNILYTTNGGGSWATTSADPFAIDENASSVVWDWIDTNKFRLIVGTNSTDVAAKPKIAYADVTLGAEDTTAWTSTVTTNADAATGDIVTALLWATFGRLYIGADTGDIYLSDTQGEDVLWTTLFTGANQINAFATNHDKNNVWAVGASNTILREVDLSGTFAARVGPSGGGAFTAIAVANDGTLYAGNGQSIFKSDNEAENTGGWTSLKDFGTNKVVEDIGFRGGSKSLGGDSQCVWAVVDDTAGSNGEVWESLDGGATWRQIPVLANLGYNAAYFSETDNNRVIVVGDTDAGATGAIHLVS
jgi:hypothetical protein